MLPSSANFPAKLQCLFLPKRYKVLYGGRGAGRSWGIARALLIIGAQRSIRVLCAREFQNSIAESVHKVLSDQVSLLGLEHIYEVQVNKIFSRVNGTEFFFEGVKNNTQRIKSYEGIDVCWFEEANKGSRNSWGILIPTIRKAAPGGPFGTGSEIWISFNPELDTDYTYKRFVSEIEDPTAAAGGWLETKNSFVCKMNWRDNPFFPVVLMEEMEAEKKRDYDAWLNVWEGHCRQMLEGVVFAKELRRATEENRITRVPYAPEVPVDTFWDIGRADNTAIWFAQRVGFQWRVLAYYEANGLTVDMSDVSGGFNHFLLEMQRRGYIYGTHFLPHDAKAKRLGTKRTIQEMLGAKYPGNVQIIPAQNLVDGINAARIFMSQCWFDEELCADGLDALRHYRYKVIEGQVSAKPLHDSFSDGADAFRMMALARELKRSDGTKVMEKLARLTEVGRKLIGEKGRGDGQSHGWMG